MAVVGCNNSLSPRSGDRTGGTAAALGKSEWSVLGENQPVLGVDLYALSNYPAAQVKVDGKRMLAYIKNVLKADAVGIVWNLYTPSSTSVSIQSNQGHTIGSQRRYPH